jgi:hypothetical protein
MRRFIFSLALAVSAFAYAVAPARADVHNFDTVAAAKAYCSANTSSPLVVRADNAFQHYYVYTWYPSTHNGQYPPGHPPFFYIKSSNANFTSTSFLGNYVCFIEAEQAGWYDRDIAQLAQVASATAPTPAPTRPASLTPTSTYADATLFCGSASDVVWVFGRTDIAIYQKPIQTNVGIYATNGATGWQQAPITLNGVKPQFGCLSQIPAPKEDYVTYFNAITASRAAIQAASATPTPAAGPHVDVAHDLTGGKGGVIFLSGQNGSSYHEAWVFSPSQVTASPSAATNSTTLSVSGNGQSYAFKINGVISNDGGSIVAAGGGNIVAAGGGNIVAAGGGNIVAAGGGNIVAAGGGNLIGNAGGAFRPLSLINQDGAGLIRSFSSLIGEDGSSLQSAILANLASNPSSLIGIDAGRILATTTANLQNLGIAGIMYNPAASFSVQSVGTLVLYAKPSDVPAAKQCPGSLMFALKTKQYAASVPTTQFANVLGYACKSVLASAGWSATTF